MQKIGEDVLLCGLNIHGKYNLKIYYNNQYYSFFISNLPQIIRIEIRGIRRLQKVYSN